MTGTILLFVLKPPSLLRLVKTDGVMTIIKKENIILLILMIYQHIVIRFNIGIGHEIGLFSVPTSGPQLVYQRPWYVLFCLWKSAYKRSLAAYRKE